MTLTQKFPLKPEIIHTQHLKQAKSQGEIHVT